MTKNRLLWALVGADVMLAFASAGANTFFHWTLPAELAAYRHARFTWFTLSSAGGVIQLALLAMTTLFAFASWIGLLGYWRYARGLYLFAWALGLLHTLLSGPRVETAVGAVFLALNAVVSGILIGLVYFSDLARRYERRPDESTAPAGLHLGHA